MSLHLSGPEVEAAIDAAVTASESTRTGAHVAAVATANATDLASAEALANANKTTLNALIASLQAAGLLAAS